MKTLMHSWIVALMLAIALPALALDLDEARAKGAVGERSDGYVAAVKDHPSDEVKQLVDEVNAKRRAYYEEIAGRNGAPVEAAAGRRSERRSLRRRVGAIRLLHDPIDPGAERDERERGHQDRRQQIGDAALVAAREADRARQRSLRGERGEGEGDRGCGFAHAQK
jgi:uncharacterized protein YdbL (DUF1318 family)